MPDPKKNIKTKDTLYTWNGRQVNKQFSDSITFQKNYSDKMFNKGEKMYKNAKAFSKESNEGFDLMRRSVKLKPGPGTLKKKFQGGEQITTYNMKPYKMQPKGLGNNSYGMMPSNSKPKTKGKMATIPGAGKRRVVGGSGLIGYLGSGGLKAAGKMLKAFTNTPKQLFQAARYKPWKVGNKQYGHIDRLTGKVTNKFNKSVKDKPAYGIDQYSYAKTKGKASVETIKKGYPSVDPNLLKKYPTGPKLHKFHKDQSIKFAEQFNKFTKKK